MKIETKYLYVSIDRDGFYFEIGDIDKPTSMLTLIFMRSEALKHE